MLQIASYEILGRLRKVNAIVASLDRYASYAGLHPHKDAYQLAQMLRGWPASRWIAVAVGCGVRPPSDETIREIVAVYTRRSA